MALACLALSLGCRGETDRGESVGASSAPEVAADTLPPPPPPPQSSEPPNSPPSAPATLARPEGPAEEQAPVVWSARPDPPQEAWQSSVDRSLRVSVGSPAELSYHVRSAPFALVTEGHARDESRTLYDLRTGRSAGKIAGQLPCRGPLTVSPDGTLFAAVDRELKRLLVDVWSFRTGEQVAQIEVGSRLGTHMGAMEFLGPSELVTVSQRDDPEVAVWRIGEREPARRFTLPRVLKAGGAFDRQSVAFSLGGRYLAAVFGTKLRIYDLAEGNAAGEADIPTDERGERHRVELLAFSPDGRAIAGLFQENIRSQFRVLAWDLSSGELVFDKNLGTRDELDRRAPGAKGYRGPSVSWLGDASGLVAFGHLVLGYPSGDVRATLPEARHARLFPDGNHVLTIERGEGPSGRTLLVARLDASPAPGSVAVTPAPGAGAPRTPGSGGPAVEPGGGPGVEPSQPPEGGAAAGTWRARPDPLPEELSMSGIGQVRIPVESRQEVVYPARPSPFVALAGREGKITSIDLRTGEPLGEIDTGRRLGAETALSPDGRYFAAEAREFDDAVGVWSFEAGGEPAQVPVEVSFIEAVDFAGKDQLVVLGSRSSRVVVETREVPGGRLVSRYSTPGGTDGPGATFSVSPGGRYGAMMVDTTLHVFDLQTGERVGQSKLRMNLQNMTIGAECPLAFSPDGGALAVLLLASRSRLACWNFTTGKLVTFREYGEALQFETVHGYGYRGSLLEWLPGKRGLTIAGELLLDPLTGNRIYQFRGDSENQPRRFIRSNRALVVVEQDGGPDLLTDVPTPDEEEIARLAQAHRDSPLAQLPPATEAKLAGARKIELPSEPIAWRAKPDPAPAIEAPLKTPVVIRRPTEPVRLAGQTRGVAVVQEIGDYGTGPSRRRPPGPILPQLTNFLEAYDLSTGESLGEIGLPKGHRLLDVSPDGTLALFRDVDPRYLDRVDVWSLPLKKHLLGWRCGNGRATDSSNNISWAQFVDNRHVLTWTVAGGIVLWRLPECQAEWVLLDTIPCGALSPGQRYLPVGQGGRGTFMLDLLVGEMVGQLESVPGEQRPIGGFFRRDGRALAAITSHAPNEQQPFGYVRVITRDLESGRITDDFAMPLPEAEKPSRAGNSWLGAGHLLLFNGWVCDLGTRCIGWRYLVHGQAGEALDERYWYTCPGLLRSPDGSRTSAATFLNAIRLPSDRTIAATARLQQTARPVLYAGCKVRIEPHLQQVPHENELIGVVTMRLAEAGLVVADQADVKCEVRASVRPGGNSVSVGGRAVPSKQVVCQLALLDATGKRLWQSEGSVPLVLVGRTEEFYYAEDNAGYLRDQYRAALSERRPPTYLFDGPPPAPAGQTRLTLEGEEPVEGGVAGWGPAGGWPILGLESRRGAR